MINETPYARCASPWGLNLQRLPRHVVLHMIRVHEDGMLPRGAGLFLFFFVVSDRVQSAHQPSSSLLVSELLVNSADLIFDVNVLHMTQLCLALGIHGAIVAVDGSLLSAR